MKVTGPFRSASARPATWTSSASDRAGYRTSVTEQPSFHRIPETPYRLGRRPSSRDENGRPGRPERKGPITRQSSIIRPHAHITVRGAR